MTSARAAGGYRLWLGNLLRNTASLLMGDARERSRIDVDRLADVFDRDMNVHAFHGRIPSGRYLCASRLGFGRLADDRSALFRRALAAVLGEKSEQRIHRFELGGVDHRPSFAPNGDETRRAQPVKME